MIISNSLVTVFQVQGVSALISAFSNAAKAQTQYNAAQKAASGIGPVASGAAYAKSLSNVASAGANAGAALLQFGQVAAQVASKVVAEVGDMVDAYVKMGTAVANLRDLTGSSTGEAAKAASLFKVAGIGDAQEIREMIRLSKDLQSARGGQGLAALGIAPGSNKSGLEMFNEIITKAGQMQAGLRRTMALEEIFGARGAAAILPLLRMTQEERDEAQTMGAIFSGPALDSIQEFTAQTQLLGQAFQAYIVYPLAHLVLPALTTVTKGFKELFEMAQNPAIAFVETFVAVAAGLTALVNGYTIFIALIKAASAALKIQASWQAFITALQGPKGLAIVSTAAIAAGGVAYYASQQNNSGASDDNTSALQQNTAAIQRQSELYSRLFGGSNGLPSRLADPGAIGYLQRQMSLGAIG